MTGSPGRPTCISRTGPASRMPDQVPLKIAPATQSKFAKLGIHTPFDLVLHLPLRYEDETRITRIADLTPGETAQVEGEIIHSEGMYRRRRSLGCQLHEDSGT